MSTLKLVGERQWEAPGGTVTHEMVEGVGYSYVVNCPHGYRYVCETLDDAMGKLGCNKVEVGGRQAAELSRD